MPILFVPIENAVPIYGPQGKQITVVNQDTTRDVYIDHEAGRLNAAAVGAVGLLNGTLVAKNGGQVQLDSFRGKYFARANVAGASLEVQY